MWNNLKKIVYKGLAILLSFVFGGILAVGVCDIHIIKAKDTNVSLCPWTFVQGGQYNPGEYGNEGYINSVKMNNTDESIYGWLRGVNSVAQQQTATRVSNGFSLDIANNGWDGVYAGMTGNLTNRINPWSVQASMKDVNIEPNCVYTVSFKARATKKKYAYIAFGCEMEDEIPFDFDTSASSNQIIAITTDEQKFTYKFKNIGFAKKLTTTLMFGAFIAQYGWEGEDISDIVTEPESSWEGTVYISDFNITVSGNNSENSSLTETTIKPEISSVDLSIGNMNGNAIEENGRRTQIILADSFTKVHSYRIFRLNARSTANTKLIYQSKNKKVLRISSAGLVKMLRCGVAEIIIKAPATSQYNEAYKKIKVTVLPKRMKLSKVSCVGNGKLNVSWKKDRTITGYQVQVCQNKKFKKKVKQKFLKKKKTFVTLGVKEEKGTTYYVRVRSYANIENSRRYGKWSKVKRVKVK